MSPLPSDEYIKFIEQQVKWFDRKDNHQTCYHEELAAIRAMQAEEKKAKKIQKELETDGE
jgi:hypothetical protein